MSVRIAAAYAAALTGSVGVLIWPALYNRFPILFHDSGSYIGRYLEQTLDWGRSVGYGLFLGLFDFAGGLWPPILLQALLTIWAIRLVLRVLDAPSGPLFLFATVAVLGIFTGLPWYAAQIMPDILAPLMVVAIFLLAFCRDRLSLGEQVGQGLVIVLAVLAHMSHLALGMGLVLMAAVAWVAKRLWPDHLREVRPAPVLPGLILALAVGAVPAMNGVWTGQYVFTPGGTTFIFGRLVQDGIVERFLADRCPSPEFQLCMYKDRMPRTANEFIWVKDSPFHAIGAWEGGQEEMRRITLLTLQDYPWLHLETALTTAWKQLFIFATGELLNDHHWHTRWVLESRLPHIYEDYLQSRQAAYTLDFDLINMVHVPAGFLALAGLVAALLWGVAKGRQTVAPFAGFVLLALVGNAVICGLLSNPTDRYQSRLIWLAALAVVAVAGRIYAEKAGPVPPTVALALTEPNRP